MRKNDKLIIRPGDEKSIHSNFKIFHHRIGEQFFTGFLCNLLGLFLVLSIDLQLNILADPDIGHIAKPEITQSCHNSLALRIQQFFQRHYLNLYIELHPNSLAQT